jgi:hypothetical protein
MSNKFFDSGRRHTCNSEAHDSHKGCNTCNTGISLYNKLLSEPKLRDGMGSGI